MRRTAGLALFVCTACLWAAETPRPLEETYDIALLDGTRVGVCHTTVSKHDGNDKQRRVASALDLSLRRFGAPVKLRMEQGSIETTQGKILAVFMSQNPGGGKKLTLSGVVLDDDKLHVKIDAGRIERRVRWSPDVLGLKQQEALFASKKPKAGDRFSFQRYEPTYNMVLTVRVEIKPREEVVVLDRKMKLLRVEMTPDELKATNATVKPPKATWWLDESFAVVRKQTELDGLGTLTLIRTTKEKAFAASTAPAVDVGRKSLVPLNRAIAKPYDTRALAYRITVRDAEDAASLFVADAHQSIKNARGGTFDLYVHPVRAGESGKEKATVEYLAASHFIDHQDERIKELSRRAVGTESDPWKKAQRIERFVKNHMTNDNSVDLAPASRIAKSMRGDCRQHAMLTAALCRAAGLPSRTAIGLLYVHRGSPYLGFHMWAEVLVDGRWLGLDSTLGKGGVSAAHVKITQHSWYETQSLTPLLPVSSVTGKLKAELLRGE